MQKDLRPRRKTPHFEKATPQIFAIYKMRNEILLEMGFRSYDDYLRSPKWWGIRLWVLQRDGFKCFACGRTAMTVHHDNYRQRTLSGHLEGRASLFSVCQGCHRWCETNAAGEKIAPWEATDRLRERRRTRLCPPARKASPAPSRDKEAAIRSRLVRR